MFNSDLDTNNLFTFKAFSLRRVSEEDRRLTAKIAEVNPKVAKKTRASRHQSFATSAKKVSDLRG